MENPEKKSRKMFSRSHQLNLLALKVENFIGVLMGLSLFVIRQIKNAIRCVFDLSRLIVKIRKMSHNNFRNLFSQYSSSRKDQIFIKSLNPNCHYINCSKSQRNISIETKIDSCFKKLQNGVKSKISQLSEHLFTDYSSNPSSNLIFTILTIIIYT